MRVLLLGYTNTRVLAALEASCSVDEFSGRIDECGAVNPDEFSDYDLVVSFGYRHILKDLRSLKRPALNLHISYLPYNRGAHPAFWSWVDGTPSGVTIHEIDAGIDTGPICFQKLVSVSGTYESRRAKLLEEIEDLFIENMDSLLDGTYRATPQGQGSHHYAREKHDYQTLVGEPPRSTAQQSTQVNPQVSSP